MDEAMKQRLEALDRLEDALKFRRRLMNIGIFFIGAGIQVGRSFTLLGLLGCMAGLLVFRWLAGVYVHYRWVKPELERIKRAYPVALDWLG